MSDIIIWILLVFTFLIIIGLYTSEFTSLNLDEKERILELNYITENFSPTMSSVNDQLTGASEYYHWGLPEDKVPPPKKECPHKCDDKCHKECPHRCDRPPSPPRPPHPPPRPPSPKNNCIDPPKNCNVKEICSNCDITLNKNIDKYLLKSSVPACPDMSEFITKNMMNANPDLSNYILKSEVKECEKVDMSRYILKSEIPACPTCPICPECPICPVCPDPLPEKKCKNISEYNISDHPDMSNYIKKDDILKSDYIKDNIKNICGNNIQNTVSQEDSIRKGNNIDNSSLKDKIINKKNDIKNDKKDDIKNDKKDELNNSSLLKDITGYYVGDNSYAAF